MDARLRAICDISVPWARERAGLREYDGVVQDLSPGGVRRALSALGGDPYEDAHDDACASAAEEAIRVRFGELALHRQNPAWHADNLDLTCYDEGSPAWRDHLRQWPDVVDMALEALYRVPAPTARAALPGLRGLRAQAGDATYALEAIDRLIAHVSHAAAHGPASAALGSARLARLLSAANAFPPLDLSALAERADAERVRLRARLVDACARIDPEATVTTVVHRLLAEHPSADELVPATEKLIAEVTAWTADRGLVPWTDGECRAGTVPASQPHQVAMMSAPGPYAPDAPGRFLVNQGDPAWPDAERDQWLRYYGPAMLPNIAIHEVAPGHFAHSRAIRRVTSPVRRTLLFEGFDEGWAHYCEEMAFEEGFRAGDDRFAVSVFRDALLRVTRLACVIGIHTEAMSLEEAARRYAEDAFVEGRAAESAVHRLLIDPEAGHYTMGKWAVLDLRARARARWGSDFSLARFHRALLSLGAPPLGLIREALSA